MAQSPLSHQIRQLERELGVELVNRAHHVVGLTDAGRTFHRSAELILGELDRARHLASRAARGEVGTLRIGYVNEVTADLLPLSLKAFKDHFGDVELDLTEETPGRLLDGLRRRDLDVTFVRSPGVVGDLEYEKLIEEDLVAAVPVGRIESDKVSLVDLAPERFVLPTARAAQGLRKDIDDAFHAAGVEVEVVRETSPLSATLLLVAAGLGVAVVPASVAHQFPVPGVAFIMLTEPVPVTSAGVAWRTDDPSKLVQNFLSLTRDLAKYAEGKADVWQERRVVTESDRDG